MRSDGGTEYFFGQLNGYLQQMGIQREFSCRYTLEQNGVTERKNCSVVEAAQAMLEEKSAQVLLARSGTNRSLHPESDRRKGVGT